MTEAEFLAMSGATVTGVVVGEYQMVRMVMGDGVNVFHGDTLKDCIALAVERAAVERWSK